MNNDELTHEALLEETEEYLGDIRDSHFARTLKRFGLVNENRLLFIYMAHLFVENNDDRINFSDINNLYDNDKILIGVKMSYEAGHRNSFTVS